MAKKHTFTGVIQNAGEGGAFVEVPFDVEKEFGSKRPKIKASIGGIPYRGLLVRMGGPNHILLILKDIREQLGKNFGDTVKVSVELDVDERVITVPAELKRAFVKDKEIKAFFETLSYSHQKEYARWIEEAKKEETRQSRVIKTIAMLKEKKKSK
jgi:hypothetical protein